MHILSLRKIMALIMFFLYIASQTLVYMSLKTVALPLSSETDKLALLALKEKLTDGIPDFLPSWNDSLHFCQWQGVVCSPRHMRVSVLQLENENLGGTLGPSLGNLTFLTKLSLSNINLHGEISREVGCLKRLQILDLSMNNIHGEVPMELTNCSSLQVIILWQNNLTGKVPLWFGSMTHLTHLGLADNNLVGGIPASLGNLSSLETLSLASNHLEGSITHALGKLSNLGWISLGGNHLSGIVPDSLYNLSNIYLLVLLGNWLVGNLHSNLHLVFPNLRTFFIGGNQFTGTFPSSISNLSKLVAFDISSNSFSGPIPTTLGSLNKLQIFHIAINNFGSGRGHDLDFLSLLTNCTQLNILVFDRNNLGGTLPSLMGNLSTNLSVLTMASNQIFGTIPEGIGNLFGLTFLNLARNFMEGTIPHSIGRLKNLVRLVLEQNKLSGNIPPIIGNLTMLSEVYLSSNKFEGSIPFTLKYCTKMENFNVSKNNLSGIIPNQAFGYQEALYTLDLSTNSLTGSIPYEFGNLKHLSILYLYANKLLGEIPVDLGACSTLTELIMERNFFHGSIPLFLGSLRSLTIIDLSNNNLSGIIPHELENLTLLNKLDLSFNNLYGVVPIGGVFSNMTTISLIGNKNLCGGIPQLNLPPCPKLSSTKHKRSIKRKFIFMIVICGVLMISSLVFIVMCYHRKKPKLLSSTPSLEHGFMRVSYRELHQATDGFSSSNLVGVGSFGSVYKGNLVHFERPIVVKVLNLQTRGASKSFMIECQALGKIKHRNLLNILTCCSSVDYKGEDFKAIVFEYMANGSLESLLHKNEHSDSRSLNLNLIQRVNIALDVAHALDYLHHDSEEVVVHCDIKPSNILLDDDMVAHLGDFGLAKLFHGTTSHSNRAASSSTIKGTIGYVPPEYGAGGQVSPQGDIYSYGILLLEMLTGKKPTDSMFGDGLSLHKFCDIATSDGMTEVVDSRLLVPFEDEERMVTRQQDTKDNIRECLLSIARIGVACSAEFPTQRMSIKDVIMELHATKQKLPN